MTETQRPTFAELTWTSLKIGCLGFGGPAGQIALMHRIFVEEKKWIDEPRYLHALNYCMLLPGPEAQQLAVYAGWMLHGVRGGVVAGALFVLPGAVVVFTLSLLYALYGGTITADALFYGIKAAVLAFIVDALVRIGRRSLKARADVAVAIAAFTALYFFSVPFPLVILAAGALGAIFARGAPALDEPPVAQPRTRGALAAAFAWLIAWLAPVIFVFAAFGPDHVLSEVSILFSQLAVVTFGGAYALLAYLQQQAVDVHQWLSAGQMIDGLGLAETTPGPLILVNLFVGFLAGWQAPGGGLALATASAGLATWCTFAPSYVWVFAGAPYAERLRRSRLASGVLRGVSAAVLGVIASLSVWFAQHVLFWPPLILEDYPLRRAIEAMSPPTFQPTAALIAIGAAIALIRFKANAVLVVLVCAALGWVAVMFP